MKESNDYYCPSFYQYIIQEKEEVIGILGVDPILEECKYTEKIKKGKDDLYRYHTKIGNIDHYNPKTKKWESIYEVLD